MDKLLESAAQEHRKGNLQEAFHLYLDLAEKSISNLRDKPYPLIDYVKQAIAGAEKILKQIDQPQESTDYMEIPISPLLQKLYFHTERKQSCDKLYQEALETKDLPDLKTIRKLLQDVELETLELERINSQLDQASGLDLSSFESDQIALEISNITKSLLLNVTSLYVNPCLMRFFAFQEYLSSVFKSIPSDLVNGIAHALFYKYHDICSTVTLSSLTKSKQFKEIFEDNTFEIHQEIYNDMKKAHAVNDFDSMIVPHLKAMFERDFEFVKVEGNGKKNEILQHVLLTQSYKNTGDKFWKMVCEKYADYKLIHPEKPVELKPSADIPAEGKKEPVKEELDDFEKQLLERLAKLSSKK
ncbi:hypothetical protein HDV06_006630 [Boothiomyces sp. JEL0866]|nr:hypothetical protein HDV06_006630 [Boothiomyces sp. JEL0866]